LTLENASTGWHNFDTLKRDAENRDPQKSVRTDGRGEEPRLIPGDVARAICGTDSTGTAGLIKDVSRSENTKAQRHALVSSRLLPQTGFPKRSTIDAQGTEHVVRFRGQLVEKHQKAEAWVPIFLATGKLGVGRAIPTEYLRRLELQNELFGDKIRITALTRCNRFVITQPTLRGEEPSENEIRDVLEAAGWKRVPMEVQDLPVQLMGSAWWHDEEGLVLLDARKPNFKKTDFGVLPIDLILADLSEGMGSKFDTEDRFGALARKRSSVAGIRVHPR
jgi:hypothetical protein